MVSSGADSGEEIEGRLEMCPLARNEVVVFIVDGCLTLGERFARE
jgi:hypothetical protein